MQIQKIGANQGVEVRNTKKRNVSFGNNSTVNAQLVQSLTNAKKNKSFATLIRMLVDATIYGEKELKKAERKKYKTLETSLIAALLPTKILVTDMVNALFPEFDYRNKEIEAYEEEIAKKNIEDDSANWLMVLNGVLKDHEAQDQAEVAAHVLSQVMKAQFPKLQFDFSGITGALKTQYLEPEEAEEYEDYQDGDDVDENNNINANVNMNANGLGAKNNKDLQERIKLGESKVFRYEPKDENELKGFASLGGMKELKKQLTEDIIIPLKDPSKAKYNEKHYGIKMPNGILFYGPPGCGKTTIVERLSVETGLPLLELTTDSFGSEYINGSEINLGAVFDYAASIATEAKPVILFIDDVDGIVGSRSASMHDHKKSELSVFLKRVQDAPKNNIIVMAATNNYDGIDKAFTSRLRQQIYTGLPDKKQENQ